VVRCPVCESQAVTVVLNSKPHASCSACGATWIQEGSWQRAVRAGQRALPLLTVSGSNGIGSSSPVAAVEFNGHAAASIDDVIVLPDPVERPRKRAIPEPPAEELLA